MIKPVCWQIVVLIRSVGLALPELRRAASYAHEGKKTQVIDRLNEALAILNEVNARIIVIKNQVEND